MYKKEASEGSGITISQIKKTRKIENIIKYHR